MPIVARRPALVVLMCFYLLLSLVIVLVVFAGSDGRRGNSDVEGNMDTQTGCTVKPGTTGVDVNGDGQCRYRVELAYNPSGTVVNAVAWSGIQENVWGDCAAGEAFETRFRVTELTDVVCWYDMSNPSSVRLWGVVEAGAAVPSDSSTDMAAITVVVVLLSVVVVILLLYTALRCGFFGEKFTLQSSSFKPLPNEPVAAQSPRALHVPMLGHSPPGAGYATVPPLSEPPPSDPGYYSPPVAIQPHPQHPTQMVRVGLAQVPAYVAYPNGVPPGVMGV